MHPPLNMPREFWLGEGQGSAKAKVSAKRMSTTTPTIRGEPVRETLRILLTGLLRSHETRLGERGEDIT